MKEKNSSIADIILWAAAGLSWAAYMYMMLVWLNPFTW